LVKTNILLLYFSIIFL